MEIGELYLELSYVELIVLLFEGTNMQIMLLSGHLKVEAFLSG